MEEPLGEGELGFSQLCFFWWFWVDFLISFMGIMHMLLGQIVFIWRVFNLVKVSLRRLGAGIFFSAPFVTGGAE